VLVATVPGVGRHSIAMRLTEEEVAMFRHRPADFVLLAGNFVAWRNMQVFKSRLISFRRNGVDLLEIDG
jgi:hypothetical protein